MATQAILGIDIGGTKLAAGVVTRLGQPLSYLREQTRHAAGAEALFEQVITLSQQAIKASPVTPVMVGVGCGGPMEWPEGRVSPLHIPVWRAFPLKQRLQEVFGWPVEVDNDAKAFALGEALFGAGQGATNMLGMVVSTGVGGGIVTQGQLYHGATGNAGHIGHVIVAEEGLACDCGAVGCMLTFASGTWLAIRARLALEAGEPSSLAGLPPVEVNAHQVALAARQGDKLALRLYDGAARALARAIASTASLFDLDRVVMGGGVTEAGDLLFEPLRQEYARRARLTFTHHVQILPASLGPQSGVIGAASLMLQSHSAQI